MSTLEVPAGEMKNDIETGFDIPPQVAKMLVEYRDRIAPIRPIAKNFLRLPMSFCRYAGLTCERLSRKEALQQEK